MNRRLLTILLVAFFIAAGCTFLVYRAIVGRANAGKAPTTTTLVAAKTDIQLGTVLQDSDLTTIQVAGAVPKGAIYEKDRTGVVGRGVISELFEGEPVIDDRLSGGKNGGLAAAIPVGMRACAVKVDEVVGVSGFATPGMRVDVLITGTPPNAPPNNTQGTESRTLLQNIDVLSAGTEYQKDKDAQGKAKQVQVVNLLVTPEQAETLSLATNQVVIRLVLRNPMDTKIAPVVGTSTANLFADPNAPPPPPVKPQHTAPKKVEPQSFSMDVINGSKSSEEKFASPGGHQ
ncbi:MAG: Flp pilus assembly protein CpaB [Terracidiphilus sp.]|jgi:pilus assembly protein CpaB